MTSPAVSTDITTARTLGEVALDAARRRSGDALRAPGRPTVSYAELGRAVREIAAGLAALGVESGDRVGLLGGTIPEWTLSDFGALCSGAIVVPVYHTNSAEECEYVLAHAGVKVLILEDAQQAAKIASVRAQLPELEQIVVMRGTADGALTLDELRAKGAGAETLADERVAAAAPGDPATIVYTSGTTGPPKGCVLTHANLLSMSGGYIDRLELRSAPPVIFQYLPLAHVLARMVAIVALDTGGTLAFWGGDPKRIVEDIAEAAPTHVPTVPRLLEKIQTRALAQAQGGAKGEIFSRALKTGGRVAQARRAGRAPSLADRVQHAIGDRLALSKVRAIFGPRNAIVVTGAAPIAVEVLEFFDACGVTVLEGYGMTETCAAATLNIPAEQRLGSVGRVLPAAEVATAEDGEILMRGPHIFVGYHRNDEATAAVMREGGWLATGDLGHVDADGYLHITGRKKDLVITSSGKNISPELIESALRETPWISQAVVAGDRRSYLVALLTLDPDEAPRLAAQVGCDPDPATMAEDPRVRAVIEADVAAANQRFATIEQVKRFTLLPRDLSQVEGELTPTLKVKRSVVYERYAPEIAALYGD